MLLNDVVLEVKVFKSAFAKAGSMIVASVS